MTPLLNRSSKFFTEPLDIAVSLRYLFLVSSYVLAILCPLIVYQKTQNLSLTGLFFLMELAPRYIFYFYANDIIKRFGIFRPHALIEVCRLFFLVLFVLSVSGILPWWIIIPVSALSQAIYALQNTAYEIHMKTWTPNDSAGHGRMLRAEYLGSSTAMLICFAIQDQLLLSLFLVIINLLILGVVWCKRRMVYTLPIDLAHKIVLSSPLKLFSQVDRKLWGLSVIGLSIAIPIATTFTAAPYFLEYALGHAVTMDEVSIFTFIRMFGGFLAAQIAMYFMFRNTGKELTIAAFCIIYIGLMLMLITGEYFFLGLIVLICFAGVLAMPWQKAYRQSIMLTNNTTHLTGVIIATNSFSSVIAGLLYLMIGDVYQILCVITVLCPAMILFGLWLLLGSKQIKNMSVRMVGIDPISATR